MLSIKEIVEGPEFKALKEEYGTDDTLEGYMKASKAKYGGFVDWVQEIPDAGRREAIYETVRKHSLREILGGGTGSDFMSYMVPTKIYQVLLDAYREADIMDKIAGLVINDFEGGSVNVDWGLLGKIKPRWGYGLGSKAFETEEVDRVTITPDEFGMDMAISRRFLEDQAFDLIEYHVRAAGKEMADFAVARALEALYAGRDTGNNEAGATNAVAVLDFINAQGFVTGQGGIGDTCVLTRAQVADIISDTTTFNLALEWKERATRYEIVDGFIGMSWYPRVVQTTNGLYDSVNADYYALVFEKARSLACAWKRPITIDNYTAPREGLVGAVASARVGFGALHNGDYISAILEGD